MRYVDRGADRVVFGTAAVSDPGVVQEATRLWPEKVAVALDARNGKVAVAGWKEITRMDALELALQVRDWGVERIQYTDVMRDGTLMGPNVPAIDKMARETGLRLTAAGGVSILEDLVRLRELEPSGVDEVVVGKALYEKRFTLEEAHAAVASPAPR
jgi:phosphoribosylformimino-5-aminoimidazole carboxamide ribotide isomerase